MVMTFHQISKIGQFEIFMNRFLLFDRLDWRLLNNLFAFISKSSLGLTAGELLCDHISMAVCLFARVFAHSRLMTLLDDNFRTDGLS